MLGRLTRWLRALGRDVLYDEALDDDALARTARGWRRWRPNEVLSGRKM